MAGTLLGRALALLLKEVDDPGTKVWQAVVSRTNDSEGWVAM